MKNKKHIVIFLAVLVAVSFSFQSKFFEIAKQIEIYNNLFKELNINYVDEINPAELTDKAIKNTLENLDPYTRFYNEQDVEKAKIQMEGEYGGIGVSVYYDKNGITIAEIYEGFSADKAGLKPGDIITNANGLELKNLENEELSLKVNRQGKLLNINLTLDKVVINPVPYFNMVDQTTGYIVLTKFNQKASSEVKKAFLSLKEKGMKKLVLDLRNNPGGSLRESINIVNFFIPKGSKVVETKGKIKKQGKVYQANNDPLDLQIPIVILINRGSASASEIVSGALQDYDRAVILGERSYGKGLVQRFFKLSYGTQLKATVSKYYTPSGRCIQELDYANRDSKGNVPKFSDGNVTAFKTQNGRTVYDGGGVTPDIKINRSTPNEVTKKVIKSRVIFNFVTNYLANKNILDANNYSFSNTDFNSFKNYLQTIDTTFLTNEEQLFKKAYQEVKNNNTIASEYEKIKEQLKTIKVKKLEENKDILMALLQNEVLNTKFYKKGMYEHHLKNDNTLKDAVALLQNTNKYQKILAVN